MAEPQSIHDIQASRRGSAPLSPANAGILALSGSDTPVPVGTPVDPLEKSGNASPTISVADNNPILPPSGPSQIASVGPVIGKQAVSKGDIPAGAYDSTAVGGVDYRPSTKEMIAKIMSGASPTESSDAGSNFGDLLKGAGSKLGDFLQRWGMGLQGAPTGATQGDIQRSQAFELQKAQVQAEVQARQMAMENQYQTQRMQLQNQMNIANIPIEKKADLQNQIQLLDAQYKNEVRLMPQRIQQERAMRGMAPGADPGAHFVQGQ